MKSIYKRHGCTPFRIISPTIVQIPLFILVSLALRSMSGWTSWSAIGMAVPIEPLLLSEGFGTIQNLAQPDGSFILPVMIGLLSITNIEVKLTYPIEHDRLTALVNVQEESNCHVRTSCLHSYWENLTRLPFDAFSSHDPSGYASTSCKFWTLTTADEFRQYVYIG